MSATERSSARRSVIRFPEIGEMTMLAIVAAGFLLLHLLTAIVLMPASREPTMPRDVPTTAVTD